MRDVVHLSWDWYDPIGQMGGSTNSPRIALPAPSELSRLRIKPAVILQGDDYFSPRESRFDVPMRLGNPFQGKPPIDNGSYPPRLDELSEEN